MEIRLPEKIRHTSQMRHMSQMGQRGHNGHYCQHLRV